MSSDNYQQQQNEEQLLMLSLGTNNKKIFLLEFFKNLYLANNQNQPSPVRPLNNHLSDHQSQSTTCLPTRTTLDEDEHQLLNAIHAHPNKRDLVLNLLRQMNQPTSSMYHQPHHPDSSTNYKS